MTQTLQAIRRPDLALSEMLRVGREAIVTFQLCLHQEPYSIGLSGSCARQPTASESMVRHTKYSPVHIPGLRRTLSNTGDSYSR